MKKLITIILAAACMTPAASATTRIPVRDKAQKMEIRRALRSGGYYLETHTTVRLMPRTEKTPRGLKRRSTVIFLRKHDAEDSTRNRNVNIKTM